MLYSRKVWQGKSLANLLFLSFWWKKVLQINRSAKTLLIISIFVQLDGFSLANHKEFTKFAKLFHYTVYCRPLLCYDNQHVNKDDPIHQNFTHLKTFPPLSIFALCSNTQQDLPCFYFFVSNTYMHTCYVIHFRQHFGTKVNKQSYTIIVIKFNVSAN